MMTPPARSIPSLYVDGAHHKKWFIVQLIMFLVVFVFRADLPATEELAAAILKPGFVDRARPARTSSTER
jgi:hypothetical protein